VDEVHDCDDDDCDVEVSGECVKDGVAGDAEMRPNSRNDCVIDCEDENDLHHQKTHIWALVVKVSSHKLFDEPNDKIDSHY
jgi:hypothetical protein